HATSCSIACSASSLNRVAQEPSIPQAMAVSTSLRIAWGAMTCTCPECTQAVADSVLEAYTQRETWTPGRAVEVGRRMSSM
ncbi:hypothetical protein Pmar_PMAR020254, partial [Perkinsus marinus ATCC 50983]